jgi:uncharacterized protein
MPLLVNIRHLEKEALQLSGQAGVRELDLQSRDPLIRFGPPVTYDLQVEKVEQGVLVQGAVSVEVECDCVRCLKTITRGVELAEWTVHLPLAGPEAVQVENDCVDLTPYMREDILLALPQHPLCSDECEGLLREYGQGKAKLSGVSRRGGSQASPWDDLDRLDL